jgi:hypothetical protein
MMVTAYGDDERRRTTQAQARRISSTKPVDLNTLKQHLERLSSALT